jgi:hypothetical protein
MEISLKGLAFLSLASDSYIDTFYRALCRLIILALTYKSLLTKHHTAELLADALYLPRPSTRLDIQKIH